MALPSPLPVARGVTLLELLIVLTLMGISAALVVPVFVRQVPASHTDGDSLVAAARRTAIRRAEPLRVRLLSNGAWLVTAIRDGAIVDSGHVRNPLPDTELLLDALGGCVPASGSASAQSFDPLTCAVTSVTTRP